MNKAEWAFLALIVAIFLAVFQARISRVDTYWRGDILCVSHAFDGISVSGMSYSEGDRTGSTTFSPPVTVGDSTGPCFTVGYLGKRRWVNKSGSPAAPPRIGQRITVDYTR